MATWEITLTESYAKYPSASAETMAEKSARGMVVTTTEKTVAVSTEYENEVSTQAISDH
jgi:hypothetical protein